jgi:hypothetical protein
MTGMDLGVYRNPDDAARRRRDELILRWNDELRALPAEVFDLCGRRLGRTAAGAVGVVGFAVVVASTVVGHGQTAVLVGTWWVMAVTFAVCRALGRRRLREALEAVARPGADLWRDLDRLEGASPLGLARASARKLERASVGWMISALSLLTPLSLHFLVVLVTTGLSNLIAFDLWIAISLVTVGHCHVVLVWRGWRFASWLAKRPTPELHRDGIGAAEGWQALWVTVLWTLPSGLFPCLAFGLPAAVVFFGPLAVAVLVGVTGSLFIPVMFVALSKRIRAERALLG